MVIYINVWREQVVCNETKLIIGIRLTLSTRLRAWFLAYISEAKCPGKLYHYSFFNIMKGPYLYKFKALMSLDLTDIR